MFAFDDTVTIDSPQTDMTTAGQAALAFLELRYKTVKPIATLWQYDQGNYATVSTLVSVYDELAGRDELVAIIDKPESANLMIYGEHEAHRKREGNRWERLDYGPGGDPFTWGRIEHTYTVGPYAIVEFTRFAGANFPGGERSFHAWVDGVDTSHSYASLDHALVACVTWRNEMLHRGHGAAANESASGLFMRMIGPDHGSD